MLDNSIIVVAHPDDEILWFSSILNRVDEVLVSYEGNKTNPHWTSGRKKSILEHPIENITNLEIDEAEVFSDAHFYSPEVTKFGIEVSKNNTSCKKYKENYFKLKNELATKLLGYENVITHNPWGEYGNEEHIQIYRVIKELQKEMKFFLWYTNYCSNKSFSLMLKTIHGINVEYLTFRTDPVLATSITNIYKGNGCWTWYDDWEWFNEESFVNDRIVSERRENYGRLFPLNFIKVCFPPPPKKKPRTSVFLFLGRLRNALTRRAFRALGQ